MYMNKGNLSLTIINMSKIDSLIGEIYIDGEKVFSGQLGPWHSYTSYSMFISPRNHVAVLKINGDVSQEIKFNTILSTKIFIYYNGNIINNECEIRFNVSISKWPFHFFA